MKLRPGAYWRAFENAISVASMALLAAIPFVDIFLRKFFVTSIPASNGYLANLVVVLCFFAAMITSRENRHLSIAADSFLKGALGSVARGINRTISAAVTTTLFWSSFSFVLLAFDAEERIGVIPARIFAFALPLGFLVAAVRFLTTAGTGGKRFFILPGFLIGTFAALPSIANLAEALGIARTEAFSGAISAWSLAVAYLSLPAIIVLVLSALSGSPVFVFLGGLALAFFSRSGGALEAIPSEAYAMLITNSMPAIALFTAAGYVLAESGAGERLVDLFRAALGWMPGGIAVAAIVVSTFFTTFTGATGVSIVALGALLALILTKSAGYSDSFSHGLLIASASIGLLFLPSLVLIIYGTMAQISVTDMFLGGILPGTLLVLAMSAMGVIKAFRNKKQAVRFDAARLYKALRVSFLEALIPAIIVVGYFSGLMTLTETAASTVIYCIVIEVLVKKDIRLRDLPSVFIKSAPVIGGVLIILACARGLAYYTIDAEIPTIVAAWVQSFVHSPLVFLLLLNVALIVVGCFMDIFSAIMVVAPLIIPIGHAFGINSVHLGIIFIANLGLGYMTPPVGLNLFLASYVFEKPLGRVYRDVLPFFIVQLLIVLLVTYVPWLSTAFLGK